MIRDVERVGVTSKNTIILCAQEQKVKLQKYRSDMYEKREEEHQWMLDLYKHWQIKDYKKYGNDSPSLYRVWGCIENVTTQIALCLQLKKKQKFIKY